MFTRNLYFISPSRRARGTTLIELLMSLTLSLLVLGIAMAIYLASERQNELLMALIHLHDHSRIVLQRLEMEIQAAGFIGCPRLTPEFQLAEVGVYRLTSANKLTLQPTALGGTAITLRHRSREAAVLEAPMREPSILEISTAIQPLPGAVLLISDCRHAELFQVAEVRAQTQSQRLRTQRPLQYRYAANAEIGALEITTYAVEKTGRKDKAGQAEFAFYSTDLRGHKSLLVEGMKNLRVETFAQGRGVAIELRAAQKGLYKTEYAFVTLRN